ncbi:MAG: type II secretion system protein M [Lysobacteraceae bacterium]
MRAWWRSRPARERGVLLAGSVVAVAVLYWALVFDPLLAARDGHRAELARQTAELEWMRPAVAEALRRGVEQAPAVDGRSLLARVDAGVREAGLGPQLVAVEPQGQGRVLVRLSGADFDRVAGWLEGQAVAGLGVDGLSVQRAAGGRVDASVSLQDGR